MSSDHLEEPDETQGPEMPAHRGPTDGWHWRLIFAMILGAILVLLALVVLALYGADRDDQAKASEQTLGELASQVQAACAANPADARKVFGDVCGKAKEIDERPPEEKADPVVKGLSESEVRSVVVSELGKHKVTITQSEINQIARTAASLVPKPKDGAPPSPAQVQGLVSATILTFCAQDSQPCRGEDGPKGQDAPPITEAQLSGAVGAFCGEDAVNCRGPIGEAGATGRGIKSITKSGETLTVTYTDDTTGTFTIPDGKDGAAGRGIVSGPTCIGTGDDSYWLTKYTDDTEQRQDGPCRLATVIPSVPPER